MKQSIVILAISFAVLGAPHVHAAAAPAAVAASANSFAALAGTYEMAPTFKIKIWQEGTRFMAQATGQGSFEIFAESGDTYYAKVAEVKFVFKKDASGKVTHFVMLQGGTEQTAKKIS
jgi:hypothetical protein